uniref:Uncharacterized protein n=1 Tax=Ananas comosus var. bracteatus TaxID=296719 RepID=A0A6V7P3Q6_ANACO|nr:unnamed protein product [Ananas comosus var. bracteatus]
MARSSKLSKLKGALKRWNSTPVRAVSRSVSGGTSSASASASASARCHHHEDEAWLNPRSDDEDRLPVPSGLHPVFVGKSRRRYLLSSDLVSHPLFRHLLARSSVSGDVSGDGLVVGCEVVLFEHLLWMLENADPAPDSLDELVDFYAC